MTDKTLTSKQIHPDLSDPEFLKTLVHESNNFLSPISGFTELSLMEEQLDPKLRSYLEEIVTAVNRHAEFNQQLLMLSGRLEPVEEAIPSDEFESLLKHKKYLFENKLSTPVIFSSNREWLIRVIDALNQFSENLHQSTVRVTLSLHLEQLQLRCYFQAKPGSVDKDRFFQPFYTSRKLSAEKGLGLCWLPSFMLRMKGDYVLNIDALGEIVIDLRFATVEA